MLLLCSRVVAVAAGDTWGCSVNGNVLRKGQIKSEESATCHINDEQHFYDIKCASGDYGQDNVKLKLERHTLIKRAKLIVVLLFARAETVITLLIEQFKSGVT